MTKKSHQHLTQGQRCQIETLQSIGKAQKEIAEQIGVHPSTVSRELSRNSDRYGYDFHHANILSKKRRSLASGAPKKMKGELKVLVLQGLGQDWSPEQIAGRLKLEGKESISHVTIYKHIHADRLEGGLLFQRLRHGGKKYRPKKTGHAGVKCIPNRVDISERPAIVDQKIRIGDWERDLVISHGSRCALITIVERVSKLTPPQEMCYAIT